MNRSTEIGITIGLIVLTLASFIAFGVDTLGIIILSMAIVCLGLFAMNPED